VFKLLSALALLAAVGLAQAQAGAGALSSADAERAAAQGSFSAGAQPALAAANDRGDRRPACGARGEPACAKGAERDAAEAAPAMTPGPALMWAALGVIAFVALRRRPRS
jgi:MYXO-CTERM domain-containing protein